VPGNNNSANDLESSSFANTPMGMRIVRLYMISVAYESRHDTRRSLELNERTCLTSDDSENYCCSNLRPEVFQRFASSTHTFCSH
jgi:hypothetical protein